ncbi:MAG TPA: H-X9-DG-CTERM domain-containing protein [Chthoniobacteraceae bacterium]|nr:H-X9-DG-CTERM domain-containing protein [Chthoniobacteraceae bacterium]
MMKGSSLRFPAPARPPRLCSGAFTVVELMIVIGIVAVLMLLAVASVGKAKERAQTVRCVQNLRVLGTAFAAYAGEHQQTIYLNTEKFGTGATVQWLRYFLGLTDGRHNRGTGGPVYLNDPNTAVCPSYAPFSYKPKPSDTVGYTYGAASRDKSDPYAKPLPDGKDVSRVIHLASLDSPSTYWLLTDSYSQTLDRQIFTISASAATARGVHFRHGGRANVLFADGHVAALDLKQFSEFPYNARSFGYDERQNLIETKTAP